MPTIRMTRLGRLMEDVEGDGELMGKEVVDCAGAVLTVLCPKFGLVGLYG